MEKCYARLSGGIMVWTRVRILLLNISWGGRSCSQAELPGTDMRHIAHIFLEVLFV